MTRMKKLAPHEKYSAQLVAQAWKKIRESKLAGGKKIGKCPEIVFTELDDELNGQAIQDHIVLNSSRLESPGRELFLYSPAQSSSCRRLPHEDLQQQITDDSDV